MEPGEMTEISPGTSLPLAEPLPAGGLRILLVEDNLTNQKVAVKILERDGHRVVVAGDGQQALDMLGVESFDVVLMDIQMPVMDGYEATAAIRQRDGDGWRLPVIAVTANTLNGERERCLAAGFDDYLSKPIRWPLLKAVIVLWAGRQPRPATPGDSLELTS